MSLVVCFALTCCASFGGAFAAVIAIAGLVLSIIAKKKEQSKGMSNAGIICSVITIVISLVLIALFALLIAGATLLNYDTLLNLSSDIIYEMEGMN